MNLDSLEFALSEISYCVSNLTKKNYKSSNQEISRHIAQHGAEAERHLYRCLFSHVDFSGDGKSTGKDFHQTQYLKEECARLITKPNFATLLTTAIDNPLHHQKSLKPSTQLLSQLSKVLKLSKVQEIAFALALLHSKKKDIQTHAATFASTHLPALVSNYTDGTKSSGSADNEVGITDIDTEVLHLILCFLIKDRDHKEVKEELKDNFLTKIRIEFPPDRVPLVLAPLLYPEYEDCVLDKLNPNPLQSIPKSIMETTSLADLVMDVGLVFTASEEECKSTLQKLPNPSRDITTLAVARTLGAMAKYQQQGLNDPISVQGTPWTDSSASARDKDTQQIPLSWNMEVFVKTLKTFASHLSWRNIVHDLDHSEFLVTSKLGLHLIVTALKMGLGNEVFPIEHIYRVWENKEGQLSFLKYALRSPDIFCLTEYPYKAVMIEALKSPPDEENRDVLVWKSLQLVETLIQIAHYGHYQAVLELFKFPITHCPDMLVLALLQSSNLWTTLKKEMLSSLIPVFLENHANSAIVLHYTWHHQGSSNNARSIVMRAMANWYLLGAEMDQARLARIIDIAQDLKALSMLLAGGPFPFVIDLACLASRREFLKLDKWLSDKIREYGEPFIVECIVFLRKRWCPQLPLKEGEIIPPMKAPLAPLTQDTVNAILSNLHNACHNLSTGCQEDIMKIMMYRQKQQQQQQQQQQQVPLQPAASIALPPNMTQQTAAAAAAARMPMLERMLSGGGQNPPPPAQQPFPPQQQQQQQPPNPAGTPYNPVQNLASQLHGMNLGQPQQQQQAPGAPPIPVSSAPSQQIARPPSAQQQTVNMMGLGVGNNPGGPQQAPPQPPQQQAQQGPPQGPAPPGAPQQQQPTADVSSIFPAVSQQFSKEIEDEANSYFQRIYNNNPHPSNISIDEVLNMLKRFKDSQDKKEREVFACMLRNLFEEYRFFPQYPERELQTTAILFGGIIEQGLVTYMDLGIALRYVLEALRKLSNTKMYVFGITALDRFKSRLKDYPQYCQHLSSIAHFNQFPPHLQEYIEYGARSLEPPNRPQGPVPTSVPPQLPQQPQNPAQQQAQQQAPGTPAAAPQAPQAPAAPPASQAPGHGAIARPAGPRHGPSIATATNIDTLLAGQDIEEVIVPPEVVQDKVFFIFNNLSIANMEPKASELMEHLTEDYVPWVSQYMVMKRASIEANFHNLYAKFLDFITYSDITPLVIRETFRNIRVLLRSDKGLINFSDRSLLKNLGHWLGILTLAKNNPIMHLDLDMKNLLYEAYHKGKQGSQDLLFVVPFIAKVMEACSVSSVFKPPNPWTLGLMNVLAELHREHDLKLNLKFEIEVLCKNLLLDVNDLHPGDYLASTDRLVDLVHQLSAPKKIDASTPQPEEPLQINMPTPNTSSMMPPIVPGPGVQSQGVMPNLPVSSQQQQMNVAAGPQQGSMPQQAQQVSGGQTPAPAAPQPQFGYSEINVMSLASLGQHISINEQLAIFGHNPQFKMLVRQALERTVQEFLPPVVDRAVKIALTLCEHVIKKDFALDPDEQRLRNASHNMTRFMTAGMALITGRELIHGHMVTGLKSMLLGSLRGTATQQQKEQCEHAATIIATDNVELVTAFIQKTAVEKAIPEIDNRLKPEYELRSKARAEGRRYCDPAVLTYQAERMPEQIRLKVGHVTHQQLTVYEEFARNIPGFRPSPQDPASSVMGLSASSPIGPNAPQHAAANNQFSMNRNMQGMGGPHSAGAAAGSSEFMEVLGSIGRDVENLMNKFPAGQLAKNLQTLVELCMQIHTTRDPNLTQQLLSKGVEGVLESFPSGQPPQNQQLELAQRYREGHMRVLKGIAESPRLFGHNWATKTITKALTELRDELKMNVDGVELILRSRLLHVPTFDVYLAQSMDFGLNYGATLFAMNLLQRLNSDGAGDKSTSGASGSTPAASTAVESEFFNTVETLSRIASHSRQAPEGLAALIENLRQQTGDGGVLLERAPGGPTSMMHSGITQAREFDDPPGLHEKTEYLLREWVTMFHSPAAGRDSTKAFSAFVGQMHQQGILKTDDLITRFFRLCTEMCVDLCYRALTEQISPNHSTSLVRAKCFHTLDAFVRLIALLVKHSGDTSNTVTKINLLNKVLGIVAGVLLQDHEVRGPEFQQLPYHRIFIMLFIELNAPEHVLESINYQVLTAFCNTLHILRPAKAPGFAYAWLELVSHRVFIGRMLALPGNHQRGTEAWTMYAQLLIDLFKFLAPFLRNAELSKPMLLLYKGSLRVLLVLLHDFPEFLCDFHYSFCDCIPCNCIQLRNLILSAYPRQMRLPDPVTPNLKVDRLQEISHPPRIMTNFANMIQPQSFKNDLDSYLKTRSPVTFVPELRSHIQISNEPGSRFNIPLLNALVLYVGTQAISYIHSKGHSPSTSTIAHSAHMDIFQNLAVDLDTEGRYLFLNAIANQLRYPNSHTHYFSCTLLYLFAECNMNAIQEQITRVLLERLIVNRPHPWGLLITFIELLKNPQFKFWSHEFVHCAPEIEKLFECVGRTFIQPRPTSLENDNAQPMPVPS